MKHHKFAFYIAKQLIPLGVASGLITAVFYCVIFGVISVYNITNGFLTGFLIAYCISCYLSFSAGTLRKLPVFFSVIINSIVSFLLIFFLSTIINMCYGSFQGDDYLQSAYLYFTDTNFLFGMLFGAIATILFIFVREIILLLGDVTFFRFIIGSYHRPRKEELAVMFVDIVGSTTIAERIGEEKFLSFISDFFCDLSEAVVLTGAEIHKYVGDEAIIVWSAKKAFLNDNCIRFYERLVENYSSRKEYYNKKYELAPNFRVGLHFGTVVAGEVGNIRKEIAYLGDVLNTTSRIISECKNFKTSFLCSPQIVSRVKDSAKFSAVGEVVLRGKEASTVLYSYSI